MCNILTWSRDWDFIIMCFCAPKYIYWAQNTEKLTSLANQSQDQDQDQDQRVKWGWWWWSNSSSCKWRFLLTSSSEQWRNIKTQCYRAPSKGRKPPLLQSGGLAPVWEGWGGPLSHDSSTVTVQICTPSNQRAEPLKTLQRKIKIIKQIFILNSNTFIYFWVSFPPAETRWWWRPEVRGQQRLWVNMSQRQQKHRAAEHAVRHDFPAPPSSSSRFCSTTNTDGEREREWGGHEVIFNQLPVCAVFVCLYVWPFTYLCFLAALHTSSGHPRLGSTRGAHFGTPGTRAESGWPLEAPVVLVVPVVPGSRSDLLHMSSSEGRSGEEADMVVMVTLMVMWHKL